MAIEEAWKWQERWATSPHCESAAACLLDLRARVEALEQRAAAPAPEPAPAPAADRPLWAQMAEAAWSHPTGHHGAAELESVAAWLAARGCADSADMLRTEARRAREGA